MGRKLEFPERILTPLAAGTTGAIDAIRGDQPRVAFIREAIERELRRRGARVKQTSKKNLTASRKAGPRTDLPYAKGRAVAEPSN
jgi:hypothetical protein